MSTVHHKGHYQIKRIHRVVPSQATAVIDAVITYFTRPVVTQTWLLPAQHLIQAGLPRNPGRAAGTLHFNS